MDDTRPLISIIVPVLNEEQNIQQLYETVVGVMASVEHTYQFELLFTDNHSVDASFQILKRLAAADPRVRVLRFSRNFGYQRSILTGYLNAAGEAVIQLDCDLQDPPTMVLDFLREWRAGYEVVYGIRKRRQEGFFITSARQLFYRVINALSEHPLPIDAGDFRLVDRRIVEELRRIDDATPYLRGTIATLGFRQLGIEYVREARKLGESKFRFRDLAQLAMDGLISHSLAPLRLGIYVSQAAMLMAFVVLLGYVIACLTIGENWPAGFTTLSVLILFSTALNAFLFGVQGEYIGRIYRQVKRQPISIVEESLNVVPLTQPREQAGLTSPVRGRHTQHIGHSSAQNGLHVA